jgi:hypothetical protein
MMDTRRERILAAIKKRPGMRDLQIADSADCNVDDVNKELLTLVQSGQVRAMKIEAENGQKVNGYWINEAFLGWNTPGRAAAPSSGSAADDDHLATVMSRKKVTKVDRAVACVLANDGVATSEQLQEAMGLPEGSKVRPYVKPALDDGRLLFQDGTWRLQKSTPNAPPAQVKTPTLTKSEKETKPVTRAKPTVSPVRAKEPGNPGQEHHDAVQSSMSIGGLQIIVWQRGGLVVSANDGTVELRPEQATALRAFVGLMQ